MRGGSVGSSSWASSRFVGGRSDRHNHGKRIDCPQRLRRPHAPAGLFLVNPQNWSLQENNEIDLFCKNFHNRSEVLAIIRDQPSLVPFLDLDDFFLLNENIEGEVFDIDKKPENLIRARIVHYNAGNNTFEIDTEQLDVWDDGTGVRFWTQTDIPLNLHLHNHNHHIHQH